MLALSAVKELLMFISHPLWFFSAIALGALAFLTLGIFLGRHFHLLDNLFYHLQGSHLDMESLLPLYDAQLFDRALELCDQVLSAYPQDSEALFHRGLCLVQLERYDEALEAFTALMLRNPRDLRSMHQAAYCLFRSGMNHGALAYMDYVTLQVPKDAGFQLSRADILSDMDRSAQALEIFQKVPAVQDNDMAIAIQWGIATCHIRMNQYDEAVIHYQKALELGCSDPECRLMLSQAYERGGQPEQALEAILKQLLLTPDYTPCHLQAARLLLAQGDAQQALSYLTQAAKHGDDGFLYERARCLSALGQREQALETLKALMEQQNQSFREYLAREGETDFPDLWQNAGFQKMAASGSADQET
jgi:tetratricopeptide (TPR) repeat protein